MNLFEAHRVDEEIATHDFAHEAWRAARPVEVARYWSGEDAPFERHASARALWSEESLCVRFDCRQAEPLVVSDEPQTARKTIGLWERDVCEIFIAPDANEPRRYYEFEVAPTGEWLDLAIHQMPERRETDWEYSSGITTAASIEAGHITIVMRIPFEALGRTPHAGDAWRANLFRCIGSGEGRGYLAWQPTHTEKPDFHVPEVFGWLRFS
ncbi:MAG TPA: carbohydrate-binding family 9-like protein [Pyrinomonadaceae bacterium]